MAIIKVWIDEGCIVCNACEAECVDVFKVTDDTCIINAAVREDGQATENRAEKGALKVEVRQSLEAAIVAAAAGCPVNVIQYEQVANAAEPVAELAAEVVAAPAVPMPVAAAPVVPSPAAIPAAPVVPSPAAISAVPVVPSPAAIPAVPVASAPTAMPAAGAPATFPAAGAPAAIPVASAPAAVPVAAAPAAAAPVSSAAPIAKAAPAPKPEAPAVVEAPVASGPYVYDLAAAPNRQVVMPKTVPLPSLKTYLEEQAAAAVAEEAKWKKTLADFETAKAKALAEEKDAPKAPVRPVPKVDANDMKFPAPVPATDPDLLHLQALLGDKVEEAFQQAGELTCQISKEAILLALELCREDLDLGYEMLSDETATHYPAAEGYAFSVVYHLTSIRRQKRLRLRILVPEGFEPESAVAVYPTANWLEREIWDMLGIRFKNHPDMTRILCPEDWEGHPLRKEYPTVGLGQRDIDFREDRSGVLMRIAMEKAGNMGININPPRAE